MSGAGFVKIYGSILRSSVWLEDSDTRVLWITLLTMADRRGFVEGSEGGIAHAANITRDACAAGLAKLSAPDPDSKSKSNQGRRIRKVSRGWLILNYERYRELRTADQVAEAERKREWRKSRRDNGDFVGHVPNVPDGPEGSEEIQTEEEAAADSSSSSSSRELLLAIVPSPTAWAAEFKAAKEGMHGLVATDAQIEVACRDYLGNGASDNPNLAHFRAYLRRAVQAPTKPPQTAKGSRGRVPRGTPQDFQYDNPTSRPEDVKWQE